MGCRVVEIGAIGHGGEPVKMRCIGVGKTQAMWNATCKLVFSTSIKEVIFLICK